MIICTFLYFTMTVCEIVLEDYLLAFGKRNMNNDKFWMMIHDVLKMFPELDAL